MSLRVVINIKANKDVLSRLKWAEEKMLADNVLLEAKT